MNESIKYDNMISFFMDGDGADTFFLRLVRVVLFVPVIWPIAVCTLIYDNVEMVCDGIDYVISGETHDES